jgi:filamentous hemagglutinin family protein
MLRHPAPIRSTSITTRSAARPPLPLSRLSAGLLLIAGVWYCAHASAADLPTGGQIVSGSGAVTQSGSTMTVQQDSARLAIDWAGFSIGAGHTVNFVQPSAASVALNRVTGGEVSVIQGALNANGQVFLINPNGVLFSPSAQVNVGGIVASTLDMSEEGPDRYRLSGASANAVINQGNIRAADGGTIALVAARVINEGTLTANAGRVLLGAGATVTLDLGGPVKLQVNEAALDALIVNGGAIRADGGQVMLTARAAGDLVSTVINHSGVIEARTLATGETGEILLLGDMESGRIAVSGRLDASAPDGGDGGFIETSAAHIDLAPDLVVTAAAPTGASGLWLIDPTDITIAAASCTGTNCISANTIASTLNGGTDVSIATASAGGQAGNITVNAPISWSSNKLSLSAHNNILINATLEAIGTGSLHFAYGQASSDGAGSSYQVASGSKVLIPAASAFTWQKGSAGAVRNLVFDNGLLRFGNGTQASINNEGQLLQPWYFDNTSVVNGVTRNGWFKLTFSSYPLNLELGVGGDGSSSWNRNGEILGSNNNLLPAITARSLDISGYREGSGVIVSAIDILYPGGGSTVRVTNTYTLGATASFLKADTAVTNLDLVGSLGNVRLWVGTQDDYIATRDSQFKFKGNLTADGFEQIATQDTQSKALKITEFNDGLTGAAVLFYSTSDGADTSIARCCSFSNATGIDPRTSLIARGVDGSGNPQAEDGSYALFIRLQDLAPGQSNGMTWYYAAGPVALLDNIVSQVSTSAGVRPPAPPPPPANTRPPLDAAVQNAQQQTVTVLPPATPVLPAVAAGNVPAAGNRLGSIGSLQVTEIRSQQTGSETQGGGTSQTGDAQDQDGGDSALLAQVSQSGDALGMLKVFVVDGGVLLPDAAGTERE